MGRGLRNKDSRRVAAAAAGEESASSPRKIWVLGFLLIAAVAIAYLPAWHGKPIWDDNAHITSPELRLFEGLIQIWTEPGATQQYYPLVMQSRRWNRCNHRRSFA